SPLARGTAQTAQRARANHGKSSVHGAHNGPSAHSAPHSWHACGSRVRPNLRHWFKKPDGIFDNQRFRAEDTSVSKRWFFSILIGATMESSHLNESRSLAADKAPSRTTRW